MKYISVLLLILATVGFAKASSLDSKYIECMNLLPAGTTDEHPAATVGRWQIFYDSTRRNQGAETIYIYDLYNKSGSVKEITEDGTCYSKTESSETAKGKKATIGTRADLIKRNFNKLFENDKFVIKDPKAFYNKTISICPSEVVTQEFKDNLKQKLGLPSENKSTRAETKFPGFK
ncbi:MAG: hypothetical protein ACXWRA_14130 [Pseudobdellovibrionaceae bacterium]